MIPYFKKKIKVEMVDFPVPTAPGSPDKQYKFSEERVSSEIFFILCETFNYARTHIARINDKL